MPIDCEKVDVCPAFGQGHCPLTFGQHCNRCEPTTPSYDERKKGHVVPPITVVVPPHSRGGERWQLPDYLQPRSHPKKEVTIKTVKYTVLMIARECVGGKWEWTNVPIPKSIAVTAIENANPCDVIRQGLTKLGYSFTTIRPPINNRILCFMEAINGGGSVLMSANGQDAQSCFEVLQASALGNENTHQCWFVTVRY